MGLSEWYGTYEHRYDENVLAVRPGRVVPARIIIPTLSYAQTDSFVTVWRITQSCESAIISTGGYTGIYTVDGGDQTAPTTGSGDQSHVYAIPGDY